MQTLTLRDHVESETACSACTRMQTLTLWDNVESDTAYSACTWMQTLMLQDHVESDGSLQGQSPPVSFETGSLVYYCISQAIHLLGTPPLCLTSPCRPYNVGSLKLQIQFTTSGCRWFLGVQARVLRLMGQTLYPQSHLPVLLYRNRTLQSSWTLEGNKGRTEAKDGRENTRVVEDFEHHKGGAPELQLLWSGG